MKKYFTFFFIIIFCLKSYSQNSIKIIASGNAYTKEKATFSALRNALEKGSGVYISSKTIVQNDQLVFDEVASLSNGTISKYDIIESIFSEKLKEHQVTISATIEVGKFVNLIKSAGVNVSFEGASFAQNVKLNHYYKDEEPKILSHFFYKYGWQEIFEMFDKKIIADEPRIYKFTSSIFQVKLEKDWHKHENLQLINQVRYGRDLVLDINKIQYFNPFYLRFKSPRFSFIGEDFGKKEDSISNVIESWKELFENKINWTAEQIAEYSKINPNHIKKIYDWNDYAQYKLIDSMNQRLLLLQNQLRNKNGQYVINLVPELKTNENYKNFIESFKKILTEISVNKDTNFSKSSFEEKFGQTYSVNLYELVDGVYKKLEFIIRNPESIEIVNSYKGMIGALFSGNAIIQFNTLKTNIGPLDNYVGGLNLELNSVDGNYFFDKNDGFVINPLPNKVPIATQKDDKNIDIISLPRYSISQFADLEMLEKIKEFTIDNPPTQYFLPPRPNDYLVDNSKIWDTKQYTILKNKLNEFYEKYGIELFIVVDNNDYSFDNLHDLTSQYGFEWQIGGKDHKGLVIKLNNKNRKFYIRYGSGLDNLLSIEYAKIIISTMKPILKTGNHLLAFIKAIDLIETKISNSKK